MKTGVENGMLWSEIGSGFGQPGGTPPPPLTENSEETPSPPGLECRMPTSVLSSAGSLDSFKVKTKGTKKRKKKEVYQIFFMFINFSHGHY